jgi:ABC-type transport system substrate-binding protein
VLAGLESDVDAAFDPQKEYYSVTWGFYHCCLLRTLVTTPHTTADNGGNELQPDLATDLPEVSEDGLTYTFTIKEGLTFAPPYQDQAITAQTFINAMEREATPAVGAGYPFYYSVIEGFDEFSEGEADSISGMTAVDDTTLEVTLTRPAGDFPFRMMMPAAAPIPDGAADGHNKDYGRFLISSGPYMLEGADQDFGIASLGGECFGEAGAGFLRFSCAEPNERLRQALDFIPVALSRRERLAAWLERNPQYRLSQPYPEA